MEWEQIDDYHKRAKIKGGWLVKAYEDVRSPGGEGGWEYGYEWHVTMCFVPDQLHAWKLR